MTRAKTLLFGILIGAAGLALYAQLKRAADEEDPEILMDRLAEQLADLEKRMKSSAKHPG